MLTELEIRFVPNWRIVPSSALFAKLFHRVRHVIFHISSGPKMQLFIFAVVCNRPQASYYRWTYCRPCAFESHFHPLASQLGQQTRNDSEGDGGWKWIWERESGWECSWIPVFIQPVSARSRICYRCDQYQSVKSYHRFSSIACILRFINCLKSSNNWIVGKGKN